MESIRIPMPDLPQVRSRVAGKDWYALGRMLRPLHPAQTGDILAACPFEETVLLLRLLGPRRSQVFPYLGERLQRKLLRFISPEQLTQLLGHMRPDDRTRLLEGLPAHIAHALLGRLPASEMKQSLMLLGYPEDTAGRHMTPEFTAIPPGLTAGEALAEIRRTGRGKETLNVIYIVDDRGRLVEDVRLGTLVMADPAMPVADLPDPGVVSLLDSTPVEEVVRAFAKYDRVALPVVDRDQMMLGILTVDDVLDVAAEEGTKDIHKMGGMEALDIPYAETGFWSMVRKRGGWLAALFLGEMLTATAMSHYEHEISRAVVLALFVPLIISTGGNSGSQATSLIIRSLALQELRLGDWWKVFHREILSGLALGVGLGAVGFARIMIWQHFHLADYGAHHFLVALTVWGSLVGVVMFGTLAGSMLPFLLRRLGFDPATSSAPFVATLVDVTGLVIYFQIASLVLRGTLL